MPLELRDFFVRLRDTNAEGSAAQVRAVKAKALSEPSGPVVNDSRETVQDGVVVDRWHRAKPSQTVPDDVELAPLPHSTPGNRLMRHPAEAHPSEWATNDPRHLLPRPVFDPALRRSGYAAYVSPRARWSAPNRFERFAARFAPSRPAPVVEPHTFHAIEGREF